MADAETVGEKESGKPPSPKPDTENGTPPPKHGKNFTAITYTCDMKLLTITTRQNSALNEMS